MRHIAIVGHGYVGAGMERFFQRRPDLFSLSIYDTAHDGADRARCLGADIAFICVPTPPAADGSADISAVAEAAGWLDADLIVIKSTVPPGTTDMLSAETGKALHFSPEFMGEPRNFVPPWLYPDPRDSSAHDWAIVGGPRASAVLDYYQAVMAVSARLISCSAIEAEFAKYMDNAYFAAKVTFCTEFAEIAAAHGVDYKRVRELWLLDPRIDRDHTAVFAGDPGFGGKCLPKDLSAIVAAANAAGVPATMLSAAIESNRRFREGRSLLSAGGDSRPPTNGGDASAVSSEAENPAFPPN